MHLKYPKKRGFLAWDELGCLARALGFQADLFSTHLPEELTKKEAGISIRNLYHVVDFLKYLNAPLDRTVNIHTDEWNLNVLRKVVGLLDTRVFSFAEIQAIRMAYQVYESPDTKGLVIDEWVLLRALKMCGRTISPLKMMHRIKHMRNSFEEPDRIQLHEFFNLLLWCEQYEGMNMTPKEADLSKDKRKMFKMEEFEEVLSHHDERLAARLNALYHKEEWRFTREKHSNKKMPKDIPPVNAEFRRKQVRHHQEKYRHLRSEVARAQKRVFVSRAGYVRPRPLSAPDLQAYEPPADWSATSWTTSGAERPQTVYEITQHLYNAAPHPTGATTTRDERPEECEDMPRPRLCEYVRAKTPYTVTSDDVTTMQHAKESLGFEIETIDQKYERMLEEDQDDLLPGYRARLANMPPKPPPEEPPPSRPPTRRRPDEETLGRLSASKRPGTGSAHGKACDARYRGWFATKARKGPHIILTAPSFDHSPTGRLLTKLHQHTRQQGGGIDHSYRYTRRADVHPSAARVFTHSTLASSLEAAPGLVVAPGGAEEVTSSLPTAPSRWSSGDHEGGLNSTTESGDSRGLSTDSRHTAHSDSSGIAAGVQPEAEAGNSKCDEEANMAGDRTKKSRFEKRKKGVVEEPLITMAAPKEKAEERAKEKVIEIRKVGRVEVLAEIAEKGEAEEEQQNDKKTMASPNQAGVSKVTANPGSEGEKIAPKQDSLTTKAVDDKREVKGQGQKDVNAISADSASNSSKSSSTQVPFTREITQLVESGPAWLSKIVFADLQPMRSLASCTASGAGGDTSTRRACERLAQRLGEDSSSELRYRLLASMG